MAEEKRISLAVIKRLPRYYRYLGELLSNGIMRISSKELSKKMNITASQIRQDLNNFGGFGQQGYGYNVEFLYNEIKKILGINRMFNVIVIGAGNIGQALANYTGFEERGFAVKAMFDSNPMLVGMTIRGVSVYNIDYLKEYVMLNHTDIAVLALPKTGAVKVVKMIEDTDIKGIWNFSPIDLKTSVTVENVHLTDSLMTLSYRLNESFDNK